MSTDFKQSMNRPHISLIDPVIDINVDTNIDINNDTNIIPQRPRYSDTHKGSMIYIETTLVEKLDTLSRGKKGMKSQIVNEALKQFFKKNKI